MTAGEVDEDQVGVDEGQDLPMVDGLPDLNVGYAEYEGRILLGVDLVLTWGYAEGSDTSPRALTFEAEDATGDRLVTLAIVPVPEGQEDVPAGIYRDVWRGACSMARRLFPSLL